MVIFLDFDGTLAETQKFVHDMFTIFKEQGIAFQKINNHYQKIKIEIKKGKYLFNVKKFLDELEENRLVNQKTKKTITLKINKLLKNFSKYIPQSSVLFLKKLKKLKLKVILLSYGDKTFQKEKINSSGILKIFPTMEIFITEKDKSKTFSLFLKKLKTEKQLIFFINDNQRENLMVKKEAENLKVKIITTSKLPIKEEDGCFLLKKINKLQVNY